MRSAGRRRIQLPAVVIAAWALSVAACSDDGSSDFPDSSDGSGGGGRRDAANEGGSGGASGGGSAGSGGGSTSGAAGTGGARIDAATDAREAASNVSDAASDVRDAASDARDAAVDVRDASNDVRDAGSDVSDARDAPVEATQDSGSDAPRDATLDCGAPGALTPPAVPTALQPPPGAVLSQRLYATGTQIYTCTGGPEAGADGGSPFAWVLKAPDALLYGAGCVPGGTHFGGPTWQSSDGSSVVGARAAGSDAAGTIPWLLLRATSNNGEGIFSTVTAIQRVDTAGGVAPAAGCDAAALGTERAIAYSATYYFYTGGNWSAAEAGADGSSDASDGNTASDASSGGD